MTNILCIFVVFVCFVCSGHSEVANDEQNSLTNIRNRRQIIYYRPIVGYYPQRIQYVNNPYYYGSNYYPQYSAWDLSSRKRREAIPSRHEHDAGIGFGSSDFIREDTNFDAIDQPNDDTSNTHRMKRQVKVVSDANDNNVDDSEASARSKQDSHFNWQRQTLWDLSRRKRQTNQDSDNNENNADDSKGNSRNKHDSKHFHQRYSMWDLSRRKRQINQVADNNDKNADDSESHARTKQDTQDSRQLYSNWDLSRKKRQTNRYARPSKGVLPHYTKWDLSSKKR